MGDVVYIYPGGSVVKNLPAKKIPWRRKWQPTPVFLSGESHGQGSLVATVHVVAKSQTRLSVHTCFLISNFAICQNQRSFNFLQARLLQFFSNKEWGGNIRTPRHLESSRVFYCFFFLPPSEVCGIFVPLPEMEPKTLKAEAKGLNRWTAR